MGIDIVSPGELVIERPGHRAHTVIIDARRREEFLEGHIPGATWMGWEAWCMPPPGNARSGLGQPGYWGVLSPMETDAYALRLASFGLRDDASVVIYADGPRTRGREGRIAWMLLYLGARDVVLLDGGWNGWVAAGGAREASDVLPETGHMSVSLRWERRRTLSELRLAHRMGVLPMLVDTRSRAEFEGEAQDYLPRRGHLPGAQLVPFADLFAGDGRYVPQGRYMAQLPPALRPARELVAYCEVGVRASLFALLHELYTGTVVPVYDGSLMEWSLQDDLPVEISRSES